jgi:hypothetical protein
MFKSILVLESPWDSGSIKSKSVWPFVNEFARATGLSAYHQTFSDKSSFRHWVAQYNKEDVASPKLLYVAAHGGNGRIAGLQKEINGKTIISTVKKAKNLRFVHFGSCLFGTENNLEALLQEAKHLQWAAGYEKSVDWVDSTLMDVMFWRRIASRDEETKGRKTHSITKELIADIPGLVKALGFRLQYRYGEKISSISHDVKKG